MGPLNERFWIRLLPWRQKSKAEPKSAEIKFRPKLGIARQGGWACLELQLMNRSSWTVWAEEATVVLVDLDAEWQTTVSTGQAKHEILQNVEPNETLSVSLVRTIYDAAGRPQGRYSCLVVTDVRYRVFDEWRNAKLETCCIEMAALSIRGLRGAHECDKKIKKTKGSVGLRLNEQGS